MLQEEFSQVWQQTQSTRFGWQRQLLTRKEKDLMSSQFKHVRDQRILQKHTEPLTTQELLKRLLFPKTKVQNFHIQQREQQESCFSDTTTIYNRRIRLTCSHPCCHLIQTMWWFIWGYNCFVFTYSHALSCVWQIAQMNHHMIWIGWQQGCKHVNRIRLYW